MQKTPQALPDFIVDLALQKAKEAFDADEIPVGAVVFHSDTFEIVSCAHNETECKNDPSAHAEIVAIRGACEKLQVKQLVGYSIFTTLEPCVMCAGAIGWARLDHVYFGASDPKTGAVDQGAQVFIHPQTHHKPNVVRGIRSEECGALMTKFFKNKRLQQKEKKNLK